MGKRLLIIVPMVVAVLVFGAVAVYAYDRGHRNKIAAGITVQGVDIGGLTAAQARARLRHEYLPRLSRPVVVRYHKRQFRLAARAAHVTVDIDGTVAEAMQRSRSGTIFGRVARSL